ncbi:MAG: hypothetical protein ACOY3L_02885 [Pseudomonadota bacterium]
MREMDRAGARMRFAGWLLGLMLLMSTLPAKGQDQGDNHAGYYYPPPQETETHISQVAALPDSDRNRRIGFVTGLTKQLLAQRYDPGYAVFAKGDGADKLIIVSLEQGRLDTVYRARALLATLTAVSRMTPFFQQNTIAEQATFLDLLKLLGFKQVTVSDGDKFAQQIQIQ